MSEIERDKILTFRNSDGNLARFVSEAIRLDQSDLIGYNPEDVFSLIKRQGDRIKVLLLQKNSPDFDQNELAIIKGAKFFKIPHIAIVSRDPLEESEKIKRQFGVSPFALDDTNENHQLILANWVLRNLNN